ncbi:MAG: SOS response-associated peptidase [Lachnospiraceae bacterium]|nr:SOS response-associated peptidase [Lachnospiraceae bacterium]
MDDASTELSEIIEAVKQSALVDKFINKFAKPITTSGEVRPTDIVPVLAPDKKGDQAVFPMHWGFHNPSHNSTVFNARVETAGSKPTFKDAWKSHRCIVPATYYFEWEHFKSPNGRTKTGDKYLIQPVNSNVAWLCGLYRIENGFPVFVVLTTEPHKELRRIHDRMPLIIPDGKVDEWISPESDPDALLPYMLTDMVIEKAQ